MTVRRYAPWALAARTATAAVRCAATLPGTILLGLTLAALLLPPGGVRAADLPNLAVQDAVREDGALDGTRPGPAGADSVAPPAGAAVVARPGDSALPGATLGDPLLSVPGEGEPDPHAVAVEVAPEPEPEQEPASTIDVLDEDNRLEPGQEGDGGDSGDVATQEPGDAAEPDATGEAAAVDGAQPQEPDATADADEEELFPTSPGIEKQKAFWIEIFTHYDSHQGVLHDGRIALPVYESLDLNGMRYRTQRRFIRARKVELITALRGLAETMEAGNPLNNDQAELLTRLPPGSTPKEIREFSYNVRFQRGLADRFLRGLERSGALQEHMRRILAKYDVPEDLMYLPHVESSFNNATLSKFGAAGIWQFTRGTGRMFMTLRYEVDERLDPIIATESAAKFLRQNYERLGTWPLAITAYNHGPQSLERITRRMGTRDLGVLIEDYDGRLFKFASKNFYAEFLAAREVASNPERYFDEVHMQPTLRFEEVELPWYLDVEEAADILDISVDDLRELNPALRHPVWSGAKYIPPGYALRIPQGSDPARFLAAVPEDERHDEQKRSLYVRVSRGDTLYAIGRRHGISWRDIALANNISSVRRLRPGQKLILPWDGPVPPPQVADAKAPDEDTGSQLAEQVVERIPVQPSAPWTGGKPQDGSVPIAEEFQELRIVNFDPQRKAGEIVAAYGETVGGYAEWAGVTASEFRSINGMSYSSVLRPGETYTIPLDAVGPRMFEERRMAFHREREQSFFAEYNITEKVKVEVRRGQSPWQLAQRNNVPMWLFYKENPELLSQPLRVGMEVILPIVRTGGAVTP